MEDYDELIRRLQEEAGTPAETSAKIRAAPQAAPPLEQPSLIGRLAGYSPTTTLGAQIGRWYETAGGLDKAIAAAQQSQQQRPPGVLSSTLWPKWTPQDVTQRRPAAVKTKPAQEMGRAKGLWLADESEVWLREEDADQATLEHELSHNAYSRDGSTVTRQSRPINWAHQNWDVPEGEDRQFEAYTLDPPEVDVRLAEIKRHYAHHTGRIVDSPEEAQRAWDWYRQWQRNFKPGIKPKIERPGDNPTMHESQFELYDSLPEAMRKQMLHRMPELVGPRRPAGGST
jgi:hypothetical protein